MEKKDKKRSSCENRVSVQGRRSSADYGGSRTLVKHVNTKNHKVIWVCNGRKRKGKDFL